MTNDTFNSTFDTPSFPSDTPSSSEFPSAGSTPASSTSPSNPKQLCRTNNGQLGGVCDGLAEYFDADATVVRVLFLIVALATGWGFLAYLLMWAIMPLAITTPTTHPAFAATAAHPVAGLGG